VLIKEYTNRCYLALIVCSPVFFFFKKGQRYATLGFKVLTAVVMKRSVFWDITYSPVKINQNFGGIYCLRFQCQARNQHEAGSKQDDVTCQKIELSPATLPVRM
jgi:hypothetical protein